MKRLLLVLLGVVASVFIAVWVIGLMLPVNHVAERARWLAAPRDSVWRLITDVRAYPEWRSDLDSVTVAGDPTGWREYGSFGTIGFRVEERVPPDRFVTRIADEDLGFGGRWIYALRDSAGGTVVSIREEGEITNAFFRTISRFVMGYDATMQQYLEDLEGAIGGR